MGTFVFVYPSVLRAVTRRKKMFDEMPNRDLVSWSSVISCYVENGRPGEGMEMFRQMITERIRPDVITLLSVADG
ncbi:hypothetical protein PIB30_038063 [Stylosanthes scabra]|uniref:Pentatricopeptide repeat-containing protein n=1 Tax=Stylosanthes scabra TaxID=79078 RepID=A0ABU6WF53_9FABA|nr:hypothetical protein [Stylosanthes scabra]